MNYYYRKNRLFLYWHVGKFVFEYQKKYPNTYGKLASFLQYYFGMTNLFSLKKIIEMERFYIYFPIYNNNLENWAILAVHTGRLLIWQKKYW